MSRAGKSVSLLVVAVLVCAAAVLLPKTGLFGLGSRLSAGAQTQQNQRPPSIGAMGELVFRIQHVEPGSPAEQAGLQPGDLILLLNGNQIESINDVWGPIHGSADKPVEVGYLRYNPSAAKFEEGRATVKPAAWGAWRR